MKRCLVSVFNLKCFACCFSDPSFNLIFLRPSENHEDRSLFSLYGWLSKISLCDFVFLIVCLLCGPYVLLFKNACNSFLLEIKKIFSQKTPLKTYFKNSLRALRFKNLCLTKHATMFWSVCTFLWFSIKFCFE